VPHMWTWTAVDPFAAQPGLEVSSENVHQSMNRWWCCLVIVHTCGPGYLKPGPGDSLQPSVESFGVDSFASRPYDWIADDQSCRRLGHAVWNGLPRNSTVGSWSLNRLTMRI
jgi:hypothetical protein